MSFRFGINAVGAIALFAAATSVWAGNNKSIEGTLIGEDGKGYGKQEIRAQRKDVKAKPVAAKTDAQGHYVFKDLPAGKYIVTAYVAGFPKSRAEVQTRAKGWIKLDFDLRLIDADNKDVDRMQQDLSKVSDPNRL